MKAGLNPNNPRSLFFSPQAHPLYPNPSIYFFLLSSPPPAPPTPPVLRDRWILTQVFSRTSWLQFMFTIQRKHCLYCVYFWHLFCFFLKLQNGGSESSADADGKSGKSKRRPRPEPLFIPPPKQGTFIAPPIYSSITPYQSHLRSPVRLVDNPLTLPPYTPPPILSPVREGSGLYFSTILSAAAAVAGSQGLPPPATPKSATRSLLRSSKWPVKAYSSFSMWSSTAYLTVNIRPYSYENI